MPDTPIFPLDAVPPVDAAPEEPGPKPPARFRERVRERSGAQDLLVVRVGHERFAVPLESVDELVESPRVRAIPGAPEHLVGLFTLGDATLPLYSPSTILGQAPLGEYVALVMRGGGARVAIAVDDADDVLTVSLSRVLDAPRTGYHDDVVLGVIWNEGHLLTLLDARAIVASYVTRSMEAA